MSQHMAALGRANEVRLEWARVKRDVKAGEVRVSEILREECPELLANMPVEALVLSTPFLPRRTYRHALESAGVGAAATLGRLTERQRLALALPLEAWEYRAATRRLAA
jgi:hypothetical protein